MSNSCAAAPPPSPLLPAGDALVLERWTEDRFLIHIRIVRKRGGAEPPAGAPTAPLLGRALDAAHQAAALNLAPNMAPPGP